MPAVWPAPGIPLDFSAGLKHSPVAVKGKRKGPVWHGALIFSSGVNEGA